ncbi:MAG: serine/threonine-protein kinase, partial [Planctomycetota bacterium]
KAGTPGGSLVELLLRESVITPDDALAMRAEYDRKNKSTRVSAAAPAAANPKSSSRHFAVQALAAESAHGNLQSPERVEVKAPRSASQQILAVFSDRPTSEDGGTSVRKAAPADPLLGTTIGGCEILDRLGEGGMGTVYRARHIGLDKIVAIKVLPRNMTDTDVRVERFRREARSAAQIEHPNIVQIHNVGEDGGVNYIIMQYIQGEDLRHRLRREGPLDPAELLHVAIQVAKGLVVAHEKGIVHRDIKPDNIMFDETGHVKLTDFGLAKNTDTDTTTTRPGKAVGTPYYMSPEQCAGKECDARSDIYSLGATMYHVLTGRRPFRGDTPVQTALMHLRQPLTPPKEIRKDTPDVVNELICRMMAKNPAERFQSCTDLIVAFERAESALQSASPLDMISALMGNRGMPVGGSTGVHEQAAATAIGEMSPPMEDATEPGLPTVARSNDPDAASGGGSGASGAVGMLVDADDAATSASLDASGEQSEADGASAGGSELPHWSVLVGGAIVLLLIGAVVGLVVTSGNATDDPDANRVVTNTSNDPSSTSDPDSTGNTPANAGNAREDLALLKYTDMDRTARAYLASGNFSAAEASVRDYLDAFAGTAKAADAGKLLDEVMKQMREHSSKLLAAALARADAQQDAVHFQAALDELHQGDVVKLRNLALAYPADAAMQGFVAALDTRTQQVLDNARRYVDRRLEYADERLRDMPPNYFGAIEHLRTTVDDISKLGRSPLVKPDLDGGILVLVAQLEARIAAIARDVATGQTARKVAVGRLVEEQKRLAHEFCNMLPVVDAAVRSASELKKMREQIHAEWIVDESRALLRPQAQRLLDELDELAAIYAAFYSHFKWLENRPRAATIHVAGQRDPFELRIKKVDVDGLTTMDVVPDQPLHPFRLEWRDLQPTWLISTVRLELKEKLMWLLAMSYQSDARERFNGILDEKNPGTFAWRFGRAAQGSDLDPEKRRERFTSVHSACEDAFSGLALALRGGAAEGLIDRALILDERSGPATLARAWLSLNRALALPISDRTRPSALAFAQSAAFTKLTEWSELVGPPAGVRRPGVMYYYDDPLFVTLWCHCAYFHAVESDAHRNDSRQQRLDTMLPAWTASEKAISLIGSRLANPPLSGLEADDWRRLSLVHLRSSIRLFQARYRVVKALTSEQSFARSDVKDALTDDPTNEDIWRLWNALDK